MAQYVVRLVHTPDQCPTSNRKLRDMMTSRAPEMPALAEKLKVKIVIGPLILGAEHEGIAVIEADKIETVYDFINQSGLIQWNTARVSPAMSMQDAMKELDKIPPPLY